MEQEGNIQELAAASLTARAAIDEVLLLGVEEKLSRCSRPKSAR